MATERLALRIGAICLLFGGIAVFGFRLAHGDLPAAHAQAALAFIAERPIYAPIHLGAILGVLVWVGGVVAFADALTHRVAWLLGRLGVAGALVGAAVYVVDFSIDGFGGRGLAEQWATAPAAQRTDLESAANTLFQALGGTSLTSIAILWGVTLVLCGFAARREGYPSWVGWTGVVVGAATFVAAVAQFLRPDLMPGVWIYGGLVSLAQLWSLTLAAAMWRRAGATPNPVAPADDVRNEPSAVARGTAS